MQPLKAGRAEDFIFSHSHLYCHYTEMYCT